MPPSEQAAASREETGQASANDAPGKLQLLNHEYTRQLEAAGIAWPPGSTDLLTRAEIEDLRQHKRRLAAEIDAARHAAKK